MQIDDPTAKRLTPGASQCDQPPHHHDHQPPIPPGLRLHDRRTYRPRLPLVYRAEQLTMTMQLHPEMMRWAQEMQNQRQERERRQAVTASRALQAKVKQQNHQHDVLQAARMAGA